MIKGGVMNPEDREIMSTKKIKKLWNRSKKYGTKEEQTYWQDEYEGRVGYRRG